MLTEKVDMKMNKQKKTGETVWTSYSPEDFKKLNELCGLYEDFLSTCKTEREAAAEAVREAQAAGYRNLDDVLREGQKLKPGDKVYAVNMKKAIALFQIGKRPLSDGMRILGAHIDSPRMDVKQHPLYEGEGLAYFDTHYYGGIKKYQWVTIPLAIHGVVAKKDGSIVDVVIGEDDNDPIFCVTDLLIHLAKEQMEKKGSTVVEGEDLDVLIGSRPLMPQEGDSADEKAVKEAVKANTLQLLKEKYGIEEDDFISAELEIVPAGRARDMGFDRSMVAAYGQDDIVCAYTSLYAMLHTDEVQEYTGCCLLVDKEEIGSVGATGMTSRFFENTVAQLLYACRPDAAGQAAENSAFGQGACFDLMLRQALKNSKMLSSDVSAAFDPLYASSFDKKNSAFFGKGLVFNKYTGARGKSSSNDANAEYVAFVRRVMDDAGVTFQTAELGRVDAGGGGTIAYISAVYDMDVIDSGVAVLSMHSPLEVTSKADIYEAAKGYAAFLKA